MTCNFLIFFVISGLGIQGIEKTERLKYIVSDEFKEKIWALLVETNNQFLGFLNILF